MTDSKYLWIAAGLGALWYVNQQNKAPQRNIYGIDMSNFPLLQQQGKAAMIKPAVMMNQLPGVAQNNKTDAVKMISYSKSETVDMPRPAQQIMMMASQQPACTPPVYKEGDDYSAYRQQVEQYNLNARANGCNFIKPVPPVSIMQGNGGEKQADKGGCSCSDKPVATSSFTACGIAGNFRGESSTTSSLLNSLGACGITSSFKTNRSR